jgi:hypothetical protein
MDIRTASFVVNFIYLVKWQCIHLVRCVAGHTTRMTRQGRFREIVRNVRDAALRLRKRHVQPQFLWARI